MPLPPKVNRLFLFRKACVDEKPELGGRLFFVPAACRARQSFQSRRPALSWSVRLTNWPRFFRGAAPVPVAASPGGVSRLAGSPTSVPPALDWGNTAERPSAIPPAVYEPKGSGRWGEEKGEAWFRSVLSVRRSGPRNGGAPPERTEARAVPTKSCAEGVACAMILSRRNPRSVAPSKSGCLILGRPGWGS